jgi:bla regulator protein BlaR1
VNGRFIGYVEKDGNTYIFATNIEASNNASSGKAKEITLNILGDKHIYE